MSTASVSLPWFGLHPRNRVISPCGVQSVEKVQTLNVCGIWTLLSVKKAQKWFETVRNGSVKILLFLFCFGCICLNFILNLSPNPKLFTCLFTKQYSWMEVLHLIWYFEEKIKEKRKELKNSSLYRSLYGSLFQFIYFSMMGWYGLNESIDRCYYSCRRFWHKSEADLSLSIVLTQ